MKDEEEKTMARVELLLLLLMLLKKCYIQGI
jgi:hypothetical protein